MPARALLVLLVMLNLGVATWWLLRPATPPEPPRPLPAEVPRLQLLNERAPAAASPSAVPVDAAPDANEDGTIVPGAAAPAADEAGPADASGDAPR